MPKIDKIPFERKEFRIPREGGPEITEAIKRYLRKKRRELRKQHAKKK